MERFAIRSKYMTLDPNANKYIKHFEDIRTVQSHLCIHADRISIPKVDNTNIDRSIGLIHRTVINLLANMPLSANFSPETIIMEYAKIDEEVLRSKEVLRIIRSKSLRKRSSSDLSRGL
jgi:hypothetical protein